MNSPNRLSSEIQGTALGKCLRAWTCVYRSMPSCESRRDQEEGGELDSQEEASPEEIKSKELGYRERELGLFSFSCFQTASYGHCLCDSVMHSSWDSNCVVRWSLRNAGRTLP